MLNRYSKSDLTSTNYDVLVIGGGINGCGVAREASSRGLKVLLVEKKDFGWGCSSAASRLIHGGLRYLEYFEFDLVRESLRERELLLKNAAHLVKPIKLTIPIYKNDVRSGFLIRAGMFLYDILSFDKSLPNHKTLSARDIRSEEPSLLENDLTGGAVYYDAQIDLPERICVENILMASNSGATTLNHCEAKKINVGNGEVSSVLLHDNLSGEDIEVTAKMVLNVAGPWVDQICDLTSSSLERRMGGTRGSHIIVKRFKGGPDSALYVTASDGRPFFIIPWLDYYLIGTTDEEFYGDLDKVMCSDAEKYYLINEANKVLKNYKINESDLLYTYAGVRPLPFSPGQSPAERTRRHIIYDHAKEGVSNFASIIGGKLTTYRRLSEEIVNFVCKKVKLKGSKSNTKKEKLIGAPDCKYEEFLQKTLSDITAEYNISESIASNLIDVYGVRAFDVLKLSNDDSSLLDPIAPDSLTIKAEVYNAILNEKACTISDVIFRRTTLGLGEDLGAASIDYVSDVLVELLDVEKSQIQDQKKQYENKISIRNVSRVQR